MRVLVSGDREYDGYTMMYSVLAGIHSFNPDIVIIEGEARGADTMARKIGEELEVEVKKYPAQWAKYGRAAGPIRNQQMLDEGRPSVVLCFHDDFENSKGTKDMATRAEKAGVPTYLISRL